MKLEIYDTTLREGEQSAAVSFTHEDKIKIIKALDGLGVSFIEAGMVTSDADVAFFDKVFFDLLLKCVSGTVCADVDLFSLHG
jgi:isopropylmalate/homocitrate/citramalate synthase